MPSMTIAGEALSITEVLERYAQGEALVKRQAEYIDAEFGDAEGFQSRDVDLTDLFDYQKRIDAYGKHIEDASKPQPEPEPQPKPE